LLESRRVIHAIARNRDHLVEALASLDNDELLLWCSSRKHGPGKAAHEPPVIHRELFDGTTVEYAVGDHAWDGAGRRWHLEVRRQNAHLTRDCGSCRTVIPSDHEDTDTGCVAHLDSMADVVAGRVGQCGEAKEDKVVVGDMVVGHILRDLCQRTSGSKANDSPTLRPEVELGSLDVCDVNVGERNDVAMLLHSVRAPR